MKNQKNFPKPSSKNLEIFLEQVKKTPSRNQREVAGRLVFGMDATASRERPGITYAKFKTKCLMQQMTLAV